MNNLCSKNIDDENSHWPDDFVYKEQRNYTQLLQTQDGCRETSDGEDACMDARIDSIVEVHIHTCQVESHRSSRL